MSSRPRCRSSRCARGSTGSATRGSPRPTCARSLRRCSRASASGRSVAGRILDVLVLGTDRYRSDLLALRDAPLDASGITVGYVADVRLGASPNAVMHEATMRRIDVTCDAQGPRPRRRRARRGARRAQGLALPRATPGRSARRVRGPRRGQRASVLALARLHARDLSRAVRRLSVRARRGGGLRHDALRAGRRRARRVRRRRRAIARVSRRVRVCAGNYRTTP